MHCDRVSFFLFYLDGNDDLTNVIRFVHKLVNFDLILYCFFIHNLTPSQYPYKWKSYGNPAAVISSYMILQTQLFVLF